MEVIAFSWNCMVLYGLVRDCCDDRPLPQRLFSSTVPITWPAEWPAEVRRIADATNDALAAVAARVSIAFDDAVELLGRSDSRQPVECMPKWYARCSKRYTAMD